MGHAPRCSTPYFLMACSLGFSLTVLPATSVLAGEIITWPDNGVLRNEPVWGDPGSLFPNDKSGNNVTINANISGLVYGGVSTGSDDVTNNSVTINGATVNWEVYGGYSDSGAVTGNSVVINGGSVAAVGVDVYGGYGWDGDITYNSVTINSGSLGRDVYGGLSEYANARHNSITISGGSVSTAVGGYSTYGGEAAHNTVTISDGSIGHLVLGGFGWDANATNNSVTISGGTVVENVIGGHTETGSATGNSVTISGGSMSHDVIGGKSWQGAGASGNSVTISDGSVAESVKGGESNTSPLTGNSVLISGGSIGQNVYGGSSATGSVTDNTVTISGGTITGGVFGGFGTSSADIFTGNTLELNSNTSLSSVQNFETIRFGDIGTAGIASLDTTVRGGVTQTLVKLDTRANDITLGSIISGNGGIDKQGDGTLTLSGSNTYAGDTTISAGTLNVTGTLGAGGSYGGTITNNGSLVFIQNVNQTLSGSSSGTGSLTKDGTGTLTLSGTNMYTGNTEVIAGALVISGYLQSPTLILRNGTSLDSTGGTLGGLSQLDIHGTADWTGNLSMQNYPMNFYIPSTMGNGSTMLTVSGQADIGSSTVNVGVAGASSPLAAGNKIILIDANALTGGPANTASAGEGMSVTLKYDFDIEVQGNLLIAKIRDVSVNESAKAFSEGNLGGAVLLKMTGDLVSDKGIGSAKLAVECKSGTSGNDQLATKGCTGAFAAVSGGSIKNKTGSHIDTDSYSLMAGAAWGAPGRFTLGGFVEWGKGSYDTHNSFNNAAIRGSGKSWHLGAGVLGRMNFTDNGYTEGSIRSGRVHNKYRNSDLGVMGVTASYDTSTAYYGIHLGAGYILNFNDKTTADLYGKYFWTRMGSSHVTLSTGDPIDFRSIDSHRVRAGIRVIHAANETISPYGGIAYEYEFDGKAKATAHGFDIPAPSLKGATGIAEVGLSIQPSRSRPLFLDLGIQGYTGKREGITGNMQMRYAF